MENAYDKGGSAGSKGVDYQVSLLTIFLLNALRRLDNWRLSTENKSAGKFDDVVLELSDDNAVLLQAKHKENTKKKKVTLNQLLSTDSKNDDFSIAKYFLSYQEVKRIFQVKYVIICTNAEADNTALTFLTEHTVCSDSMLHYEHTNDLFYTLNEDILPKLKQSVENYFKNNLRGNEMEETVITDENIIDFLKHLQLYFGYPPEGSLGKITERLLNDLKCSNSLWDQASSRDIQNKIKDWFQQPRGEYLTEVRAKAIFCEIRSEKYCQTLENHNVFFNHNDFAFPDPKRVLHITAESGYLLQVIKIYHSMKNNKTKLLYINPDDEVDVQREVIETFQLPQFVFLIIKWFQFGSVEREMYRKVTEILQKYCYKKVILVAGANSRLVEQIGPNAYGSVRISVTLEDFSTDFQKKLLQKIIVFQGYDISLKELFGNQTDESYKKHISSDMIEKLIRGERFEVGFRLLEVDEDISRNYISRKFNIYGSATNRPSKEVYSEDNIYDYEEKLILIGDSAGAGKTTVLNNLALNIKRRNPHLWVIRLELNNYIRFLRSKAKRNIKTIRLTEILDSNDSSKLRNDFEKFVFSLNNKVVLMLDGLDEISPDYTDHIINLLEECNEAPNFAKIFVTTRPHLTKELRESFFVDSFVLRPLTQQSQIDFLSRYWTYNLKLKGRSKNKCEQFARKLTSKVWINLNDETKYNFTSIPLHLKMLAEIFQENDKMEAPTNWMGCKEYLDANEGESKLPESMNIMRLYQMFIEKKKDTFLDKENPSGNPMVEEALTDVFDNCISYHRTLALEVLMNKKECELFSCYQPDKCKMETIALKIGIVQKLNGNISFIHRTFAEYFVAECLMSELQKQNKSAKFQEFFIEGVLSCEEFKVIRTFLDCFLREVVDSLPASLFESYQTLGYRIELVDIYDYNLIHLLAGEGCIYILRLILKCVDFKQTNEDRSCSIYELYKLSRGTKNQFSFGKKLDCVKQLLERGGINIKDTIGWTPLHCAVNGSYLEMVKFLVSQGANVNIKDNEESTPLNIACKLQETLIVTSKELFLKTKALQASGSRVGQNNSSTLQDEEEEAHNHLNVRNLNIVQFLVEQGADVKAKDICGRDALYLAIYYGENAAIVAYLLDIILDRDCMDVGDSILLYKAAGRGGIEALREQVRRGRLEGIKHLVQYDVDKEFKPFRQMVPLSRKIGGASRRIERGHEDPLARNQSGCIWNVMKYFVRRRSTRGKNRVLRD